jgi:hypothetical protein
VKKQLRNSNKLIAAIVGIALVAQVFLFSIQGMGSNGFADVQKLIDENADDLRIATEISNMTGVTTDEILQLKQSGMTWNEVIESLKNQDSSKYEKNQNERSERLTESGLGKEYIDQLKQEGYAEEEIMEAKLLIERVLYQLNEIVESDELEPVNPVTEIQGSEKSKEDLSAYRKIVDNFQEKEAVYLLLKLKDDFGSKEEVLNEYLFSLQADIDLGLYIQDKEQYLKEKEDKSIAFMREDIITLAKIENKMLENIQQENAMNRKEDVTEGGTIQGVELQDHEMDSPLPDIPQPNVKDIKPKNPAEEMLQEIEVIDQK